MRKRDRKKRVALPRDSSKRLSITEYVFRPDGITDISRPVSWLYSFAKSDPRWKIKRYFQNLVMSYEIRIDKKFVFFQENALKGEISSARPAAFSIWRPTSMDAIRMMMLGVGTGKGLEIKGKSAKKGKLSGFVPFVQIHNNNDHKKKVGTPSKEARLRIFYSDEYSREIAFTQLQHTLLKMTREFKYAERNLKNCSTEEEYEEHLEKMLWDMKDPHIYKLNSNWGLDIPERLFWEVYIMDGDCTRVEGSDMDTGRPSNPSFFTMNINATRKGTAQEYSPQQSRPVVVQYNKVDPMDPMSLLMAYEENGFVRPVVSDFDPFLVGTRGVAYKDPIDPKQIDVLKWCLKAIEEILSTPNNTKSWTACWLEILKRDGHHPDTPRFGYGDPTSNRMIEKAVSNLHAYGAVRHGAECFNYSFPQQLDEKFLVICPSEDNRHSPYKYLNQIELKEFLLQQIKLGFAFPLNLKWVLCDPGWLEIWYAMRSSSDQHVQEALDIWYPPQSGIREEIDRISELYPKGFITNAESIESREDTDLAMLEFDRHLILKRAKRKLRVALIWLKLKVPKEERRSGPRLSKALAAQQSDDINKALSAEFPDVGNDTLESVDENGDSNSDSKSNIQNGHVSEKKLELQVLRLVAKIKILEANEKHLLEKEVNLKKKLGSMENLVSRNEAKLKFIESQYSKKKSLIQEHEQAFEKLETLDEREAQITLKETEIGLKEDKYDKLINELLSRINDLENGGSMKGKLESSAMVEREMNLKKKELYMETRENSLNIKEEQLKVQEQDFKKKMKSWNDEKNTENKNVHSKEVDFTSDERSARLSVAKSISAPVIRGDISESSAPSSRQSSRRRLQKFKDAVSFRKQKKSLRKIRFLPSFRSTRAFDESKEAKDTHVRSQGDFTMPEFTSDRPQIGRKTRSLA